MRWKPYWKGIHWKPRKRRLLVCLLFLQLELGEDHPLEVLVFSKAIFENEDLVDPIKQHGVFPVEEWEDLLIEEMKGEVS